MYTLIHFNSAKDRSMDTSKILFSPIMDSLPRYHFDKCVKRYFGDYKVRSFFCIQQFYCMAFAQLTYSTLADANEQRDWRIYADFPQVPINIARALYVDEDIGVDLKDMVYARIKAFYGQSENAVKSQIWIAISVQWVRTLGRAPGYRLFRRKYLPPPWSKYPGLPL